MKVLVFFLFRKSQIRSNAFAWSPADYARLPIAGYIRVDTEPSVLCSLWKLIFVFQIRFYRIWSTSSRVRCISTCACWTSARKILIVVLRIPRRKRGQNRPTVMTWKKNNGLTIDCWCNLQIQALNPFVFCNFIIAIGIAIAEKLTTATFHRPNSSHRSSKWFPFLSIQNLEMNTSIQIRWTVKVTYTTRQVRRFLSPSFSSFFNAKESMSVLLHKRCAGSADHLVCFKRY